jgi:hypothetical protein
METICSVRRHDCGMSHDLEDGINPQEGVRLGFLFCEVVSLDNLHCKV